MMKTTALVLVAALPALGAEPMTVFAFCNNAPNIDGPRVRELAVRVSRAEGDLEFVTVKVNGTSALRQDKTGLPATWFGWFEGALCAAPSLEVGVSVRERKKGKLRTVTLHTQVQQVD